MIPDKIYEYCQSNKSVTSELAESPDKSPGEIARKLYGKHEAIDDTAKDALQEVKAASSDELEKAFRCGKWGATRPSDLFLQIYHDALCSLKKRPLAGVVSPSLMGSNGVVPLTIISPLPDICRHIANCIVRAEKEVFLATNFWIHSDASTIVTDALRDLSRRAGERGDKVIVKMLYDRGNVKQLLDNHQRVSAKEYTGPKVKLPAPEEVPNLDFDLINFHKPMLGTFHSKFAVIDRKIGILQSSNIQDNDNVEMMIHVEGPIVDSLYDSLLISWDKPLLPPLPLLNRPAASIPLPTYSSASASSVPSNEASGGSEQLPEFTPDHPHYDPDIASEARRVNGLLFPKEGESRREAATRHLNSGRQPDTTGDAPEEDQVKPMQPYLAIPPHEPVPMAMVNREPWGAPTHSSTHTPQNEAWLAAINHAKTSIFIQTPNMNAEPLLEPLLNAVRRGVDVTAYVCLGYNDAGELLPFQNGTNEMVGNRLYNSLGSDEEKARLRIYNYIAKDQTRPIHNKFKKRSCHIKLMIVDDHVGITGNGNLDTQSYFHSQEINIMLDSVEICRYWREAIEQNQNTGKYGLVSTKDGCWHDPKTGEIPEGSIGIDAGRFAWAKGIMGAVKRVQGAGGF